MRAPLIPVAFSFISGILIGSSFYVPNKLLLTLLSILLAISLLFLAKRARLASLACLCPALLASGMMSINLYLNAPPGPLHVSNLHYTGLIGLEGTVIEPPAYTADKIDIIIESSRIVQNGIPMPVEGRVLLAVREDGERSTLPRYGDLIRTKVRLKEPQNFNNPGGFDYRRYLRLKGILVRGYIDSGDKVIILRQNQGNTFISGIETCRDRLRALIRDHAPAEEGSILKAMILGEQSEIPKEILQKFNRTGTTHILAISGFNLGIIFILFLLGFKTLLKSSRYLLLRFNLFQIATFLAVIPVILYAFIAGLGMSVVRAAIMIFALVMAAAFGKDRDLPNTLALAALIMVAIHPPAFFDVSFQLSFAAVAGILFIVPRFSRLIATRREDPLYQPGWLHEKLKTALRSFMIFILATVAATLATLPLTTYYFNTFSLIVIASNILLVPILGYAVIFLGIGIVLAAPFWTGLAVLLIKASTMLIQASLLIVDRLSSFPYASIYTITPSLIELTAFYLLLIASVLAIDLYLVRHKTDRGWRFVLTVSALVVLGSFFIFDVALSRVRDRTPHSLSVTFIDVGQGNSALIRLPGGEKMLIDGGGSFGDRFDIGKNVLAPFLWHGKIQTIDTVVLTHPHPDHLSGLLFILGNFAVREVWSNGKDPDDDTEGAYTAFKQIIAERKIRHRILHAGTAIQKGEVSITILNPVHPGPPSASSDSEADANDDSLVLKLAFDRLAFLFPGDISEDVESRLVRRKRNLRSQVLLAPHHGSRSSSSSGFIQKVQPDLVVFSCGKDNMFRLPHPDTVKRYEAAGVRILRTDRDGAVTVETDGSRLSTRTYLDTHIDQR